KEFFPLDNKGFGKEKQKHNFSFTMELHWEFEMKKGLVFEFEGDDDVWAFINNKLAMDLGGRHSAERGSFKLDNDESLVVGKKYNLDFFFAERHTSGSTITITTNIIFAQSNLRLYKQDGDPDVGTNKPLGRSDTVLVGEAYTIYGHVFDSAGVWLSESDNSITWEIVGGELSSKKGSSTTFQSSKANSEVTITARFVDPVSGKEVKKSITLYVKSEEPKVSYELKLYDSPGDPKKLTPVTARQTVKVGEEYTLYGHIFDGAGEWVSKYDKEITWEVTKSKNLGISQKKGSSTTFIASEANSEVTITARFVDPVSKKEYVKSVVLFVEQKAIPSYAVKLYDSPGDPGNLKPISSGLTINAGESITVYGHVFDITGKWYEEYDKSIKWKLSDVSETGLGLDVTEGVYTSVTLTKAGTVRIIAEFVDMSNPTKPVSRAEVSVTVAPDAAYKIDIQKSKWDTLNADQYNFDLLVFEKNVSTDSLYAIVRDKYGNFVRYADKASWKSNDIAVVKLTKSEGLLGVVEQQENGIGGETFIVVSENGLIPDTIKVSSMGVQSVVSFTINPQKPIPQSVRNYYDKLFTNGGNVQQGTLVAIETPRPLLPDSTRSDNSFGKVVVYDAVGNVVRSDLKLVPAGNNTVEGKRTYGILWDYTNHNKRQVGQGAYLFVVSGRYLDSNNRIVAFKEQVKVAAITRPKK
ncbi:MAG: fibro-slime domain-containing protein, partial [Fibrobacter sp.]|nr:fibro-slime domain-containing protein [Fibrobacter sp.]